jgi:hypothetical protein
MRWIFRPLNNILSCERERDECIHARRGKARCIMTISKQLFSPSARRSFLQSAGMLSAMTATFPAWANGFVALDLPGGPHRRELTTAFPQK